MNEKENILCILDEYEKAATKMIEHNLSTSIEILERKTHLVSDNMLIKLSELFKTDIILSECYHYGEYFWTGKIHADGYTFYAWDFLNNET